MFIFIRLILAHLIGDFLLQFDLVHALKVKGPKGLLLHVGIVLGCLMFFCSPYFDQPITWLFLSYIGITHYIQDWAKIKFTSQSKHQLFFFCLDQIVHVAFIATIFWTSLRDTGPLANPNNHLFLDLYNDNATILYYITAITASYTGHYLIILFKIDFHNNNRPYSVFEKWYGFIERIFIVSVFFLGIPWPVLVPIILAGRPVLYRAMMDKLELSDQFSSKKEIILSGGIGITTGLILYMLI